MKRMGVILLSGGLDSATVATMAASEGYELIAVTLHYGQRHSQEIDAAEKVAAELGIRQRVVDVSFFKELAWYSALTNPEEFPVPDDRSLDEMAANIPITYVPLRNTFFMTMAAAYLESAALSWIENESGSPEDLEAAIFIAANAIDYSGYPDCRPEFYDALGETLLRGSKLGSQYGISFSIKTPIIDKSKAEIAALSAEIGAPIRYTWSCYEGGTSPCGRCDSCQLRIAGFAEAGLLDPAVSEPG